MVYNATDLVQIIFGKAKKPPAKKHSPQAGNWLTSSSGGPALCRLWRRSSLLCVGLRRLTHMGGRLHALLFEHPTALNPAVVDHDNAGKPVFKTDKFILGGTFVLNSSHYNSFFALVKTNVRIVLSKVPILGQRRSFSLSKNYAILLCFHNTTIYGKSQAAMDYM